MDELGVMSTKVCKQCGHEKPIYDFHKCGNYRRNQCKSCHSARSKAWRIDNPRGARSIQLRNKYGIDSDQYDKLYASANGACQICKIELSEGYLDVDHDHSDGLVRGLLCRSCNNAIGKFNDNIDTLTAAITYLQHAKKATQTILRTDPAAGGC
jgi:hypothetical protein